MSTFKAWLIANMRFLFIALFIIILIVGILIKPQIILNSDEPHTKAMLGTFIFMGLIGLVDIPSTGEGVVFFILSIIAIIAGFVTFPEHIALFVILLVIFIAISIMVAIIASRNFYEIVSRRASYVMSNAEMLDVEWKYVFNRFSYTFRMHVLLAMEIILLINI